MPVYGRAAPGRARCTIAAVIEHVAFEFERDVADIMSNSRIRPLAWARYAIAWLARRHSGETLAAIGLAMGGRDHSTVSHEIERANALLDADDWFRTLLFRVDRMLVAIA